MMSAAHNDTTDLDADFDAFATAPAPSTAGNVPAPVSIASAVNDTPTTPTSSTLRKPTRPAATTTTAATAPPRRRVVPAEVTEDETAFRASLEPDDNTVEAKRLNARFLNALKALLSIYLIVYLLESTIGQFSPIGPDMVLLFVGWYASDGYRVRALNLYLVLSMVSLAIDTLGFISSIVFIIYASYSTWITAVLVVLFLVETAFKIASIFQGRALRAHLDILNRLPVESAPLVA